MILRIFRMCTHPVLRSRMDPASGSGGRRWRGRTLRWFLSFAFGLLGRSPSLDEYYRGRDHDDRRNRERDPVVDQRIHRGPPSPTAATSAAGLRVLDGDVQVRRDGVREAPSVDEAGVVLVPVRPSPKVQVTNRLSLSWSATPSENVVVEFASPNVPLL